VTPSVIVTGASGGIGSKICETFHGAGFSVFGIDRTPSDWTAGLSLDLEEASLGTRVRETYDVSGLSVIVHAAAEQPLGEMGEHDVSTWQRVMWTNVLALNSLVREFREEMSANRGSVVAIGSVHSVSSRKGNGAYAVSKAALEGWVRSAALEYGPSIRVNSVIPGAVDAGALNHYIDSLGSKGSKVLDQIASRTPLMRIGNSADIASAVVYLASESASFITGQSLIVDGGASLLLATEVD